MGAVSAEQASTPTGAVFLSYASQDSDAARRICDALRAASINVWFDQSELRGGDAWDRRIRKQIHDCALFIPIISANSQARLEGYFRLEWKLAVERTHLMSDRVAFLVPVVIDDTVDAQADVPERFRAVHWMRLPGGVTQLEFVARIKRLLTAEPPTTAGFPTGAASGSSPIPLTTGRPSPLRRALPIAVALLGLVALAYILFERLWISKPAAPTAASNAASSSGAPSAAFTPPPHSIAVLPFADMSQNHDQEYFGDGMAEEIVSLLVKVPDLKVIGRTSSFQFKGKADDLRKVGAALGAAYVVEGSVRRSGDHIRVTVQLIDTHDGTHRWSETYDRQASDTLKIQDEIAANVVRALQLEVTSAGFLRGRVLPRNGETYDSYLRGLHALNRFNQPGMNEAVAHFRHALTLDPHFVPAAEQLARTLCDQPAWGFVPPSIGYEQARVAADAALKLAPQSAIAHAVLGCVHVWYDWDWPAALQEVETAMALSPNDPFVLGTAAIQRGAVGQWVESLSLCHAALSTDPLHAGAYQISFWTFIHLGRFAEAERAIRRVLEISPTYTGAHFQLGLILLMEGRSQEALTEMQKEIPLGGRAAGLVLVYHALRRTQEADAELAQLEVEHASDMAMWIAGLHAFRGQKDQAFTWLEKAYAQKDHYLWTIKTDPLLKNLEADPRYKAFLRKMNLLE
jgi:TolB-like protein